MRGAHTWRFDFISIWVLELFTRQTLPHLSFTLFSSYFALPSQGDFTWLTFKFAHKKVNCNRNVSFITSGCSSAWLG